MKRKYYFSYAAKPYGMSHEDYVKSVKYWRIYFYNKFVEEVTEPYKHDVISKYGEVLHLQGELHTVKKVKYIPFYKSACNFDLPTTEVLLEGNTADRVVLWPRKTMNNRI